MAVYRLTKKAAADFEEIFAYGVLSFGLDQAEAYAEGLEAHFRALAEQPRLFQAVDHIRKGYRRSVYQAHSIYYRIEPRRIVIVRVLGRQDLAQAGLR